MTSQQELGKNVENRALQKIAISKSVDNVDNKKTTWSIILLDKSYSEIFD